jgi:hypothetical protein
MSLQDTGKQRTNLKDQYYTKPIVAEKLVQEIILRFPQSSSFFWIEPSAGNGAFLQNVPTGFEKIGLDIDPKASGILKTDFLKWTPSTSKPILVFGNPPFGRQSSLAKAFLKHACSFAAVVAFILPRSFLKPSMVSCIPANFHCLYCQHIENRAFEVNGEAYDVPCVFQIWEKRETNRPEVALIEPKGFSYVKPPQSYHIAFRRVGGTAGTCSLAPGNFNPNTHYFLRFDEKYVPHLQTICDELNEQNYPENTLGPRSISKREANMKLNDVLTEFG